MFRMCTSCQVAYEVKIHVCCENLLPVVGIRRRERPASFPSATNLGPHIHVGCMLIQSHRAEAGAAAAAAEADAPKAADPTAIPEGYKVLQEGQAKILHKGNEVFYNEAQVGERIQRAGLRAGSVGACACEADQGGLGRIVSALQAVAGSREIEGRLCRTAAAHAAGRVWLC